MFEQVYNEMKKGYKQSWFGFFFKYTALGKLLELDTQITASTFVDTYLSSWWWNRLWFRACIRQKNNLSQLDIIVKSLGLLKKHEILTEENFALVANHANPIELVRALFNLQCAGILTEGNRTLVANNEAIRTLVANHANLGSLAPTLSYLQDAEILTAANFALVANHANPGSLAPTLSYLQDAEILTAENFALVVKYINHRHLARALFNLKDAGILIAANFALVVKYINHRDLARVLRNLHRAEILTQANFTLVDNHTNLYDLACTLPYLQDVGILNQENFDLLVDTNHTALLSENARRFIWSSIPPHLLTQANFERLVTASEYATPMAEFQRILDQIQGVQPAPAAAFNQAQSTHTASVHRSVSESAGRLMTSYGTGLNLAGTIQKIEAYVNSLDDSLEHQAAKNCIARLTRREYSFTDSSGVSTRQLLALAYTAIHDETKRQGTLKDAQALFVEGLYEIQRGYNINAQGIDNPPLKDIPICSAGTFNKLMEKLNGIHPDVEVYFITNEGAYFKYPKVVEECALNYLNRLANPETVIDYVTIKKILDSMKDNGLELIWDKIKSEVEAKLWDEFKEAYANKPQDSRFRAMINNGHDSNVPDLTVFYSRLEASSGYQAFLFQLEQRSLGEQKKFLRLHRHSLWANRHNSTEEQNVFDIEYGLVLKI